jgi:hypothetical protein
MKTMLPQPLHQNTRLNRFLILCGPLTLLSAFTFLISPLFIPPVSPSSTAEAVTNYYREHENGMKAGVIFMFLAAILWPLYSIGLNIQLSKIPGVHPTILSAQIAAGFTTAMGFLLISISFASTIYRLDREPALTQLLSDIAWLTFTFTIPSPLIQETTISYAIPSDIRAQPLIPRWIAWLDTIITLLWLPGVEAHCVHHGPIAWNGAITFWIGTFSFFVQQITTTSYFWRAINRDNNHLTDPPVVGDLSSASSPGLP